MKFLFLLLLPFAALAQSTMDQHRWYLNPEGQEVLISIDDLYDEKIPAVPSMNWGRAIVPALSLKKSVVVAVIDGGIDIEHPELKNHIAYDPTECFEGTIIPPKGGEDKNSNGYKGDCAGWDFVADSNRPEDLDGHGTHVTGVINSVMFGIQGEYKFLPLKVFAPDEGKESSRVSTPLSVRLTKAFEYAISKKVDVIHMSVGWPKSFMSEDVETAIKKAQAHGIFIVAAAGNSSQRATIFPCQMEGVICVGALRPNGDVARFSNWGGQVDIFAPGEKILSTIPHTIAPMYISRKGYDYKNGTSQAAPFISASVAILRGIYPDETNEEIYARLMLTADDAKEGTGLKGLFHLDRAVALGRSAFLFPNLKGIHSVVLDKSGRFSLRFPVRNYGQLPEKKVFVSLSCNEATVRKGTQSTGLVSSGSSTVFEFEGVSQKDSGFLDCFIRTGTQKVSLKLKVLQSFEAPAKDINVPQTDSLVVQTRNGARSRFLTMQPAQGTIPSALYYVTTEKGVAFYQQEKLLGSPDLGANCKLLRVWQIDYDKDGSNELMLETICEKTFLRYQFLNLELEELYPSVTFRPSLAILNYEEFEVKTTPGLPPVLSFLNFGFVLPTETPWDTDTTSQANHFYELYPVKDGASFKYDVRILEEPRLWKKNLGLRYEPSYQVLHKINDKLLVKIGQKLAWVDVKTQSAEWANLNDVLLSGSRKQKISGSEEHILQSLLTPFEYRGFILPNLKLRFIQTDKFDPFLDILGTEKNERGYKTTVRTYQRLIYLQFDHTGTLVGRNESIVDRFDFLTAQDLIASVVNLRYADKMIQIVDGTKINTNYIDVLNDGSLRSFEIPSNCVAQQPVVMEERPTLPLFCTKSRNDFEMKYYFLDK